MKNWYMKVWFFVFIFFVISFLKNTFLGNFSFKDNILGLGKYSVEENVLGEELVPVELDISQEKESEIEGVFVPYYWKNGNNVGGGEYLRGYLPSIKGFREYRDTRDSVLTGIKRTSTQYTIKKILNSSNDNIVYYSDGMYNESSFFEWSDENCVKGYSELTKDTIFLCNNWVNWLGVPIEEKVFVLVKCNIKEENGYCMYEDYTKSFYDSKKVGETRCFGENFENYLCSYSDYIKLIKFDN